MRRALAAFAAWLLRTFDARDAMLALGLVLLAVGLWFIWPPLSLIAPGAVLSIVAILGERISGRPSEN